MNEPLMHATVALAARCAEYNSPPSKDDACRIAEEIARTHGLAPHDRDALLDAARQLTAVHERAAGGGRERRGRSSAARRELEASALDPPARAPAEKDRAAGIVRTQLRRLARGMAPAWRRKPVGAELVDSSGVHSLRRVFGPLNLIMLGISVMLGAGLLVRAAPAIADHAGPSVTVGFVLAGLGTAFAALCYAEWTSMRSIAGGAYMHAYATMGQLTAWIIGWDLLLDYAVGAATLSIAWSEYFSKLLDRLPGGYTIPFEWCHSPFESARDAAGNVIAHGIMNVPALCIALVLSLLEIRGVREPRGLTDMVILVARVAVVVLIIVLGWGFIDPANHTPYVPETTTITSSYGVAHDFGGFWGIIGAAGTALFAFRGVHAVAFANGEARNPGRDVPIAILGSLAICTLLYLLFSHVLSGLVTVDELRNAGREASLAFAITTHMPGYAWLADLVTLAVLVGFSLVIWVMLSNSSGILYWMSHDGLLPKLFSTTHRRYLTPWRSTLVSFGVVGALAAFAPRDALGDLMSIGTLFVFVLVCISVWVLRSREPSTPRAFRTRLGPLMPILGILLNGLMIVGLGWINWLRLAGWLVIGLIIYIAYGRRHATE